MASFVEEVRRYFLGTSPKLAKPEDQAFAGNKVAADLGRDPGNFSRSSITDESHNLGGEFMKSTRFSRNSRSNVFERIDFGQQMKPRVPMVSGGPPSTRKFVFKWNPFPKTLRITKAEGAKRTSS